jgi:hypothetical protein
MGITAKYALRYPEAVDPADVPLDLRELAEDVENHGPATELAYAQFTTAVTVPVVAEASAVTVVSAGSVTYSAQPIVIEFFAAAIAVAATPAQVVCNLWDGGADLGRIGGIINPGTAQQFVPAMLRRRLTPTAGAHTYIVKAWAASAAGTIYGNTPYVPGFIRIARA